MGCTSGQPCRMPVPRRRLTSKSNGQSQAGFAHLRCPPRYARRLPLICSVGRYACAADRPCVSRRGSQFFRHPAFSPLSRVYEASRTCGHRWSVDWAKLVVRTQSGALNTSPTQCLRPRLPAVHQSNALHLHAQWHARSHAEDAACLGGRQQRAFSVARGPWLVNASRFGPPDFGHHACVQRLALQKLGGPVCECARPWRGINRGVCRLGPPGAGRHAQETRTQAPSCCMPRRRQYRAFSVCARPRHAMQVTFWPNLGGPHARTAIRKKPQWTGLRG